MDQPILKSVMKRPVVVLHRVEDMDLPISKSFSMETQPTAMLNQLEDTVVAEGSMSSNVCREPLVEDSALMERSDTVEFVDCNAVAADSHSKFPDEELSCEVGVVDEDWASEEPQVGDSVFVENSSPSVSHWVQLTVLGIIEPDKENDKGKPRKLVEVDYCEYSGVPTFHWNFNRFPSSLPLTKIALSTPPVEPLHVGLRVIASCHWRYYAGTVAEEPSSANLNRYLIFFDQEEPCYCSLEDIRKICQQSYEDIFSSEVREEVKSYLQRYPLRVLVDLTKAQSVLIEYKGGWCKAIVLDLDMSLALLEITFRAYTHREWVYRGSSRLLPIRRYLSETPQKRGIEATTPNAEYPLLQFENLAVIQSQVCSPIEDIDENGKSDETMISQAMEVEDESGKVEATADEYVKAEEEENVASEEISSQEMDIDKGTTDEDLAPCIIPKLANYLRCSSSTVIERELTNVAPPREFQPHICGPDCVTRTECSQKYLQTYDPLAKPLLCGFQRLTNVKNSRVTYTAPCGLRLASPKATKKYLHTTGSCLTIDLFSFDVEVNVLREFKEGHTYFRRNDLCKGKENVAISCVNELNTKRPSKFTYEPLRKHPDSIASLDEDLLSCCSCKDDCVDPLKCSCVQLTLQEQERVAKSQGRFGYKYGRLPEKSKSAIFECNARCKCSKSCGNRVVQHGISVKLQLFRTEKMGWGLRCLHDLPKGTFLCCYEGEILTDSQANTRWYKHGDEYLLNIDYIEIIERDTKKEKDGYESDTGYDEMDDTDYEVPKKVLSRIEPAYEKNLRKRNLTQNQTVMRQNLREYYEDCSEVLVIDTKKTGNISRFFNNSCSPNVYTQNVFVNSHDPRLPWIAFFTSEYVPAGTELCFNYGYETKRGAQRIPCLCESKNCLKVLRST